MKKLTLLSLIAATTLAATAAETKTIKENGILYLGLGATMANVQEETSNGNLLAEVDHNAATVIAGFTDRSKLWGLELRFSKNVGAGQYNGQDFDSTFINMGAFIKPQYKISDFKVYGLAGWSAVYVNYPTALGYEGNRDEEHLFQYGIGGSYSINNHVDLFAEYMSMHDQDGFNDDHMDYNYKIGGITLGVIYNF